MKNPVFLVIGESCLDTFIYGNCDRLCPEAPVPVFVPQKNVSNLGMAANVQSNLKSILDIVRSNFKVLSHLSWPYSSKTRFVDSKSNHIFLRMDKGDEGYKRIIVNKTLINKVQKSDVILISDYNKGYLDIKSILDFLKYRKKDSVVIMDTKKIISKDLSSKIDYFKLNSQEYQNNINNSPELIKKINRKIIVTRGANGTDFKGENYPVEVQQTIDVSGAGDTFMAALGYSLGIGKSVEDGIIFANHMASKVVTKRGVTTL